jgi:hypothetical protein
VSNWVAEQRKGARRLVSWPHGHPSP